MTDMKICVSGNPKLSLMCCCSILPVSRTCYWCLFRLQALANTLWALATLHYHPSSPWLDAFEQQLSVQLPSFTKAHLNCTVWAMSALKWEPKGTVLKQQLLDRAAEADVLELSASSVRMNERASRVLAKAEGMSGKAEGAFGASAAAALSQKRGRIAT